MPGPARRSHVRSALTHDPCRTDGSGARPLDRGRRPAATIRYGASTS